MLARGDNKRMRGLKVGPVLTLFLFSRRYAICII